MISSRILFTKSLGYFLRIRCFLNMRVVLVKVRRCMCIGTQEPDGFSFHQTLEDTPGVGKGKMEILESVSRLEVCFEV